MYTYIYICIEVCIKWDVDMGAYKGYMATSNGV